MRLIDADALADALFDKRKYYPQWVADTIGNMPEAVVRCKDCKHRDPEDHKCDCGHDIQWQLPRQDTWFCADGKRKE